jgi:hypothetical protein
MTLILTIANPAFVLQVSDRLVTVKRGSAVGSHDPIANKTIVYRARDGLVSIGYSGIAYIGNLPTDEWIAQLLWGNPLPKTPDGRRPMSLGAQSNNWDVGYATENLRKAIASLPAHAVGTSGLYLTIAGWQATHHGVRPVVVELERRMGSAPTNLNRSPRRWEKGEDNRLYAIGAQFDSEELWRRLAPFRAKGATPYNIENLEPVLVGFIRDISRKQCTVGANVLSVGLPRPGTGRPGCRFFPVAQHAVRLVSSKIDMVVPVAHSPWVLGGGVLYPPSQESGEMIIGLRGIEFEIHGSKLPKGFLSLSSSIGRTPPPK